VLPRGPKDNCFAAERIGEAFGLHLDPIVLVFIGENQEIGFKLDSRLDSVSGRFKKVDARLKSIEARLTAIEKSRMP
jgi:hypothetical protein